MYEIFGKKVSGFVAILLSPLVLIFVILAIPLAFLSGVWSQIFPWKMSKEELIEYLEFFANGDPESEKYCVDYDQFMCGGPIRGPDIAKIVQQIRDFSDTAETGEANYYFSKSQIEEINQILEQIKKN